MIAILNGPTHNLLGKRQPEIYGHESLDQIRDWLINTFEKTSAADRPLAAGVLLHFFQSNSEGALIDEIQRLGYEPDVTGIVFNPGAYAHYSIALRDAIASIPVPVIEVHLSNIFARDEFRARSVTAGASRALISGLGKQGYALAIRALLDA